MTDLPTPSLPDEGGQGGDLAPIWRNGFGAAVEAVDRARRQFRPSIKRSPAAKAYDQALDEALQYAFDCTRSPFRIVDYPTANEACRYLQKLLDPWLAAQGPVGEADAPESARHDQ